VGMLGGGNRGWGVGNEPSRSLRGSGVVARLLRSELSAEHFSLSRLGPRVRARSVMESEYWHPSGELELLRNLKDVPLRVLEVAPVLA
jgi:hypothetical protein